MKWNEEMTVLWQVGDGVEWQVGDEGGQWSGKWEMRAPGQCCGKWEMRAPGQWSGKWEMRVDSGVASGR